MNTLLEFYLRYLDFLYLDPRYRITDSSTSGAKTINASLRLTGPTLSWQITNDRALSEQHLTGSGETVLGPFDPADGGPSYIKFAKDHGVSYFDIEDAWNAATPAERLAANQHVLDMAIASRDTITLSVPFSEVRTGTLRQYFPKGTALSFHGPGTSTTSPPNSTPYPANATTGPSQDPPKN